MSDLRPISLCSVQYKIVSKVLVKRLQQWLPQLISSNQSAFVAERLISDNILVAHELVHNLRTNPQVSGGFMAIKSDMSKAYDRVEWAYLKALLHALGFHDTWVNWVLFCVSSVSFSVLVNDQPHGHFLPSRGLRQGDPLSPFLFVLCTEGLTHLLNKAELNGKISGVQFSPAGPSIHHLLFADDSLFLCRAVLSEITEFKQVMNLYGEATGQVINLAKSSVTFGAKVKDSIQEEIKQALGIFNEGGAGTYLGLPECFSGSKVEMLAYIKDKLKSKATSWYSRLLSMGGKEILLKSVALSMSVYAMSCFKLPKTTCANLTSAMSAFWWNSAEGGQKIHWLSWEKMCLLKEEGGLGFRDVECFNQALLAKQAWRFLQYPSSLFARLFKSRYFEDCEFLQASLGKNSSFGWKSILHGRELLVKGLRKRIGNGDSTDVWIEPWVFNGIWRVPFMKNLSVDLLLKVSDLIDVDNRCWDIDKLEDLFFHDDILSILKNKPVVSQEDFYIWEHNMNGDYTVSSGYEVANGQKHRALISEAQALPSINCIKEDIWALKAPLKIRNFLWKAVSGILPVVDKLLARGIKVDSRCQACGLEGESVNHLLFTCTVARQIWAMSGYPSPKDGFHDASVFCNIFDLLQASKSDLIPAEIRCSFPWILWYLWKNRNKLAIEGAQFLAFETVNKIQEESGQWALAQGVEKDTTVQEELVFVKEIERWRPPPEPWLKCNIGCSWGKKKKEAGCAWVLRDSFGTVILHSRRCFSKVASLREAHFLSILWATESMISHKVEKVVFASESSELLSCLQRPQAWPSFRYFATEIMLALSPIVDWRMDVERKIRNRGANLIAQSVTMGNRFQSYVAAGFPAWLTLLFDSEKVSTSG